MSKPRTCPHCNFRIPINSGFYFDESKNLCCGKCKKVIIPTDEQSYVDPVRPLVSAAYRSPSYLPYQGHASPQMGFQQPVVAVRQVHQSEYGTP